MKIVRFNDLAYTPASHEDAADPGVWKKVLLIKPDFIQGHPQMINWALLPAGRAFRAHYHEDMQEVFIITEGRARITVGDETGELSAGDAVVIPPGAVHVMEAPGPEDVRYIALGISSGRGGRTIVV
jgi:mannose-1-phosphate guanylyltransferase/mannose-1-phosphate guanylyltransferase/mannose-6-phosphate isomerase